MKILVLVRYKVLFEKHTVCKGNDYDIKPKKPIFSSGISLNLSNISSNFFLISLPGKIKSQR